MSNPTARHTNAAPEDLENAREQIAWLKLALKQAQQHNEQAERALTDARVTIDKLRAHHPDPGAKLSGRADGRNAVAGELLELATNHFRAGEAINPAMIRDLALTMRRVAAADKQCAGELRAIEASEMSVSANICYTGGSLSGLPDLSAVVAPRAANELR